MINKKALKKPYKIVSSKHEGFDKFCLISGYDTREEAEHNYENDIENFHKKHRWFWRRYCFGYSGIIKDNTFI